MDCALWLNRRKIYSADEIAGNSDIASLRGYFLAGSLISWLNEHNGEHYAEKLSELRPDDPELNIKLSEIFGGSAEGKRFGDGAPDDLSPAVSLPVTRGSMQNGGSYGAFAALGSFGSGSFGRGYFALSGGSFSFGSRFFGSGTHEWEWEWLFNLYKSGSFGSFGGNFGSFGGFRERLFELFRSGSFFGGSFKFGSFGSLYLPFTKDISALDEYDRIMFETLMMCPLDRFGYGIHNI